MPQSTTTIPKLEDQDLVGRRTGEPEGPGGPKGRWTEAGATKPRAPAKPDKRDGKVSRAPRVRRGPKCQPNPRRAGPGDEPAARRWHTLVSCTVAAEYRKD